MISVATRIINTFTSFASLRQAAKRDQFDRVVQPLFDDVFAVHSDYMTIFGCVDQQLHRSTDPRLRPRERIQADFATLLEISKFMTEARRRYEPIRDSLRAHAEEGSVFDVRDQTLQGFLLATYGYLTLSSLSPCLDDNGTYFAGSATTDFLDQMDHEMYGRLEMNPGDNQMLVVTDDASDKELEEFDKYYDRMFVFLREICTSCISTHRNRWYVISINYAKLRMEFVTD